MTFLVALLITLGSAFVIRALLALRFPVPQDAGTRHPLSIQQSNPSSLASRFLNSSAFLTVTRFIPLSRKETDGIRLRLAQAGLPISASLYYGISITVLAGGCLLGMGVASLIPATEAFARITTSFVVVGLAAVAPLSFLTLKTRRRKQEIEAELPSTLEMLAIAVEAGLTLERAFRSVAGNRKGALAHELILTDEDISLLGYSKEQALQRMVRRCGSEELELFVSAVIVSSKAGAPIASILKRQAQAARMRRFQKLEAQANKIPTKMIFPLAFLIMPGVFIIAVSPAVLSIINKVGEVF